MIKRNRLFVLACLVLLSIPALSLQAQDVAEWTFMHYFYLDNDLEAQIFGDVIEITNVGSTDDVNIVAQVDRAEGYEGRYGDWTDTRRFYLPKVEQPVLTLEDKQVEVAALMLANSLEEVDETRELVRAESQASIESFLSDNGVSPDDTVAIDRIIRNYGLGRRFDLEPLQELGEVDMGTTEALVDFIEWSVTNYPADKYALIISSHGAGWMGNGPDHDSDNSQLSLPEIDAALAQARAETGVDQFELVGFDACLMGQIEVYSMLAPHARYVLAAEEVIPAEGWEYTTPFAALTENPSMDGAEIGRIFIDSYMDYYAGPGARSQVDLHLVEPGKMGEVIDAVNVFTAAVEENIVGELAGLGLARVNAQIFDTKVADVLNSISNADLMSSVDLIHLMEMIAGQPDISAEVIAAAEAVGAAAQDTVVYSRADAQLPDAHGVAIYFPLNNLMADLPSRVIDNLVPYAESAFLLEGWSDFLDIWHRTISSELSADDLSITITDVINITDTPSIYDPPVVVFDADGQGVSSMAFGALLQLEDGSEIMLDYSPISFEELLPSGLLVHTYPNGASENNIFQWNVEMPVLTDGITRVPALIEIPSARAVHNGYVVGLYTPQVGDPTPASVVIDVETRKAVSTYGTSENGAPFELNPAPGDKFTPYWTFFDAEGNFQYIAANQELTYGVEPFSFEFAPADSGTYRLIMRIEDYAGNIQISNSEVTVSNEGLDASVRALKIVEWGVSFLYPWNWVDSTYITGADGETWRIAVNDHEGFVSIFVGAHEDYDAALASSVELLDTLDNVEYEEPADLEDYTYETKFINYSYTQEGVERRGIVYIVTAPDTGIVYTLDVDAQFDHADEGYNALLNMLQSLSFFEPAFTS